MVNNIDIYFGLVWGSVVLMVYIFIYFVCLFVCLYPINVKRAETIRPNFLGGTSHDPREGLYVDRI